MTRGARALHDWINRNGGRLPLEAVRVEFYDRRRVGLGPDELRDVIGELEALGLLRWTGELWTDLELIPAETLAKS